MTHRYSHKFKSLGSLRLLPAMICLFLLLGSSTQASAQKTDKQIQKELRKKQKKEARAEAKHQRELALYADSDFLDDTQHHATPESLTEEQVSSEAEMSEPELTAELIEDASLSVDARLENYANTLKGIPYRYGGMTKQGFDCSGFTCHVFSKEQVSIPRTAQAQFDGAEEISLRKVQKGDLVFFGKNKRKISHVGIVISDKGEDLRMIHSATSVGISVTDVEQSDYWRPRLVAAGRYLEEDQRQAAQ